MSRHRFVIGVDYGTTFSGISYVTTDKKTLEDIHVIRSWPGKDGEWKTPSRIAYARENTKLNLKDDLWGFQAQSPMVMSSWTKLLLDAKTRPARSDDQGLEQVIQRGKFRLPSHRDAQGVVADYLRQLYNHLEQKLVREVGKAVFDSTPMDVWLTVPAVWSDQAKGATMEAAREAGFGVRKGDTIGLIGEPEAAAVAVLNEISRPGALNKLSTGENILVCDCGGGTVDITSYSIVAVEPVPKFEEICVGIGAKCGATSIDRAFHELMRDRFGAAWERVEDRRKEPGSDFMDRWERVKRQFGGYGDDRVQEIQLILRGVPDSEYYDEDEGFIKLTKADVQKTFDPTIREVVKLVEEQHGMIKEKLKKLNRLVIVGGFGESAYLYTKLKDWCLKNGNIQIYCQVDPQAAIVRGAALRGLLGAAPLEKRCRRHYGCTINLPFREGIDLEADAFKDFNRKMCANRMLWLIYRGARVTESTKKSYKLWYDFEADGSSNTRDDFDTCKLPLYSYAENTPPDRYYKYLDHVGTITVDLSRADMGLLKKNLISTSDGFQRVPLLLELDFGARNGMIGVRTTLDGTVVGSTEIKFK